jgi:hypothetical protein
LNLLRHINRTATAAVIGTTVGLGGVGTAVAVTSGPAVEKTADEQVSQEPAGEPVPDIQPQVVEPAAEPSAEPEPVVEVPPVVAPQPSAPPATVNHMPKPANTTPQTPAAASTVAADEIPDPDGPLPEGWLPPQNPGEPPIAPYTGPPPAEALPGEPNYIG